MKKMLCAIALIAVTSVSQASPPLVFPLFGGDHVLIASLCASASTNRNQSYIYARGGMFGAQVHTDRTVDPAAWYIIPTNGLQWFDLVSTTFHSWLGSAVLPDGPTATEFGHRMVIHEMGTYPVGAYTLTVSSSLTNIPTTTFNVATNTSDNTEIGFNSNFVGINYGPNGVLDSHYDSSSGAIVAGGDDTVLTSGLPSASVYNAWFRFGSTVSVTVGSTADFNPIKDQFAKSPQHLTATLSRNGIVVDAETVTAAVPTLRITKGDDSSPTSSFAITILGGQAGMAYGVQMTPSLNPPIVWTQVYPPGGSFFTGSSFAVTTSGSPMAFWRIFATAP